MKKSLNIVMLPTSKATILYKHKEKGLYLLAPHKHEINCYNGSNQHIYLTSDAEIKKNDYYLIADSKEEHYGKVIQAIEDIKFGIGIRKIEAASDKSLGLPLIPQYLIEYFVEKQGKVDKVMVEMEELGEGIVKFPKLLGDMADYVGLNRYHIKTNPDNTIIWYPIKDTWTREEVEKLCRTAFSSGYDAGANMKEDESLHSPDYVTAEKEWIEENL
ncbi:MAG: hypothetical protein PHS34_08935 [Candidatus Omnitrophica bacterium]|nr:hypothetical protein [Candidatus Omnitrophota bacterium]